MVLKVRSGVLAGAPELVRELGGDPEAVARAAGFDLRVLADPDTPIPVGWVVGFLEAAAAHCRAPSFGLALAPRQSLSLFGTLSPLFESAATIGELVRDIARYFPLHTRGALVGLEAEEGGLVVTYDIASDVVGERPQLIELGLAILTSELRRHCPDWLPAEIWLRHAPAGSPQDYRRYLRAVPQFNADRNAIFLSEDLLQRPTRSGNPGRHGALRRDLAEARGETFCPVCTQAEIVVRALLPFTTCDLAATARLMRMSRRTLQRRLAEQESSFDRLVDRVRADLARSYLRDSALSVAEIAEILQFSQTSALSRACRRWFGAPPRLLRRPA